MSGTPHQTNIKTGILCALGCQVLWGLLPLYWKLLDAASPLEILAHRMLWSFVFVAILSRIFVKSSGLSLFRTKRALLMLGVAGVVCTINWGVYIYSVNAGHIVQAALGYYISPLFSILLGVLVFKERLTLVQKGATVLAVVGVTFFTVSLGDFPWLSVVVGGSFALYGAIKKKAGYPAVSALAVETTLILPLSLLMIALTYIAPDLLGVSRQFLGDASSFASWEMTILLVAGGIVTAVPLLLFAVGVNDIPLSIIGFFQYVSPTISLLLGIFIFGEAFTWVHAACFGLIWIGLAAVSLDTVWRQKATVKAMREALQG